MDVILLGRVKDCCALELCSSEQVNQYTWGSLPSNGLGWSALEVKGNEIGLRLVIFEADDESVGIHPIFSAFV